MDEFKSALHSAEKALELVGESCDRQVAILQEIRATIEGELTVLRARLLSSLNP